jgi:hypothetical protein
VNVARKMKSKAAVTKGFMMKGAVARGVILNVSSPNASVYDGGKKGQSWKPRGNRRS